MCSSPRYAGRCRPLGSCCEMQPRAGTPTVQMAPAARERRPLGSSPGGARHSPPKAGGGKDPQFRGGPFPAGTSVFSVIRTAAGYTPFAALRAAVPTSGQLLRKYSPAREPQQSRRRRPQGNADLWAVLPVGPGTARRRRAAGRTPILRWSLPGRDPGVQRHPDGCRVHAFRPATRGGADRRSAFPYLQCRSAWKEGRRSLTPRPPRALRGGADPPPGRSLPRTSTRRGSG